MSATFPDLDTLARSIKDWGRELGFQQVGIADVDLGTHEQYLQDWLAAGYQGEMDYMAAHGHKRSRPAELVEGTRRVISVRMDYLPGDTGMAERLADPEQAYVSRYALGRDYHKLVRKRLQQLAERIQAWSVRSAIAPLWTAHRCWRRRWPSRRASAGSARTPCC